MKTTTVKELKEFIDYYLETHSENDEVKLIDDGMKPAYFDVECIIGTKFERRIDNFGHYEKPVDVLALTFNKYNEV